MSWRVVADCRPQCRYRQLKEAFGEPIAPQWCTEDLHEVLGGGGLVVVHTERLAVLVEYNRGHDQACWRDPPAALVALTGDWPR